MNELDEVGELRNAVTALSGRVQGLTNQLGTVNTIQQRQQEIDIQAHAAFAQAKEALAKANSVESKSVPREELERRARARRDRERLRRSRNLRHALGVGGVIFVLMAALLLAMLTNSRNNGKTANLLAQQRENSYTACVARNGQRDVQAQLYRAQIDAERHNASDPPVTVNARIKAYQDALATLPPARDCAVYRR